MSQPPRTIPPDLTSFSMNRIFETRRRENRHVRRPRRDMTISRCCGSDCKASNLTGTPSTGIRRQRSVIPTAAGDSSDFRAENRRRTPSHEENTATAVWPVWQVYPFFRSWEVLRCRSSSSVRNGHEPQKSIAIRPRDCPGNVSGPAVFYAAIVNVYVALARELRQNKLTRRQSTQKT